MGFRYIGSKARVVDSIFTIIKAPKNGARFYDVFSGTGIVASKAADLGWPVFINDFLKCSTEISESRLLSKEEVPFGNYGGYQNCLEYLNNLEPRKGYFWKEYSPGSSSFFGLERKYFTEKNASKIDAILYEIKSMVKEKRISEKEHTLLTATIISAVNNIANIAGTYGCFLSKWNSQALKDLLLEPLELRDRKIDYIASNKDVFSIQSNKEDVLYLDPPYTKRQYASYYHILETISYEDNPEVNGVSGLRPWKDKASVFCYKKKALDSLIKLVKIQNAELIYISYSNDGHIKLEDLEVELSKLGDVKTFCLGDIGRYISNEKAKRKGNKVSEFLIELKKG